MLRVIGTVGIAAVAGASCARIIGGQEPTRLEPNTAATYALRGYADTMDILLVHDGVRQNGGRFAVSLTTTALSGRPAYLATATDFSPTGSMTFDTLAIDSATLTPLWHRSHAPADSADVVYRNGRATGYAHHEKQPRTPIDTPVSQAAFEGAIVGWLVPALPLGVGAAVSVVSFSPWNAAREDTTTYRVIGVDTLRVRGTPRVTWVVREQHGAGDRVVRTQWIDRATRRVLRTHDVLRNAPPGDGYWKIGSGVQPPG